MVLGANLLARGRRFLEARMSETVLVEHVVPGDPNPTTLAPTETAVAVYTGRARVVYPPTVLPRDEAQASQLIGKQQLRVDFPIGTPGIVEGLRVTVQASDADPGLVGQMYRTKGAAAAGQTTALRCPVEQIT